MLRSLLAPADLEAFLRDAWTRRPFAVHRDDGSFYSKIFGLDDLDALIAMSRWDADEIVVRREADFSWANDRGGADLNRIYLAYASGYSVHLERVDARWPSLGQICADLEASFHHPAHASLHLTASGTVDDGWTAVAETFIMQLDGTQRRHLEDEGEMTLRSGDMLYLPKNTRAPLATDGASLHLALTVQTVTFLDLAHAALDVLAEDEPRLRQALPNGFLDRLDALSGTLKSLLYDCSVQVRAADTATRFEAPLLARAVAPEGGRFAQIDAARTLTDESVVARRPEVFCVVRDGLLHFAGVEIDGPLRALDFVAATERFTVSELPMEAPLDLVRRLVEEGLLVPA